MATVLPQSKRDSGRRKSRIVARWLANLPVFVRIHSAAAASPQGNCQRLSQREHLPADGKARVAKMTPTPQTRYQVIKGREGER